MTNQIHMGSGDDLPELTSTQLEVLKHFCLGEKYEIIGKKLHMAKPTVRVHMHQIYIRLGLSDLPPRERWWRIREDICPAIKRGMFPIGPDEEKIEAIIPLKPEQEKMLDEDEKALIETSPIQIKSLQPEIVGRRGFPWGTIIAFSLGMTLMYFGYRSLLPQGSDPISNTSVPQEPEVVTVVVTPTPILEEATQESEVVGATATSLPATPTSEQVLLVPIGYEFTDDFEDGPDPMWTTTYGDVGMANGKYTILAPFQEDVHTEHLALIDDLNWGDLEITFEVSEFESWNSCCDPFGAVVLHYQDDVGGVGFILYPGIRGVQFGKIDTNREWTLVDSSLAVGQYGEYDFNLGSRPHKFRVEVNGDTYLAFLEDKLVTSATIPGYDVGRVGFWFQSHSDWSDPERYSIRVDSVSIQSIP